MELSFGQGMWQEVHTRQLKPFMWIIRKKMRANDKKPEAKRILHDGIKDVKMDHVRLTIEEFRWCKGFETVSESEGSEIIESLYQLALIALNHKIERYNYRALVKGFFYSYE